VIPAAFEYARATSAEEAIALIGQYGDEAKFLAGGHSLLPLMKLRLAQPPCSSISAGCLISPTSVKKETRSRSAH
jgi:hypothetical protein